MKEFLDPPPSSYQFCTCVSYLRHGLCWSCGPLACPSRSARPRKCLNLNLNVYLFCRNLLKLKVFQYCYLVEVQNIIADVDCILKAPETQDEGVWKYEHLRQFCMELNGLAVKLQVYEGSVHLELFWLTALHHLQSTPITPLNVN